MFNAAHNWGLILDDKTYMNLIGFYGKAGIHVIVFFDVIYVSENTKG